MEEHLAQARGQLEGAETQRQADREAAVMESILYHMDVGILLAEGIGDTLRVSLTADPVEEMLVAWEILRALGLRKADS